MIAIVEASHYLVMVLETTKIMEYLKYAAAVSVVVGGIVFSTNIHASEWIWPFLLFVFAHVVWSVAGFIQKDKALWMMNLGILPVDVYALYIRIIT